MKPQPLIFRIVPDSMIGFNVQRKHYGWLGERWVTMTWAITIEKAEEKRDLLQKELMK